MREYLKLKKVLLKPYFLLASSFLFVGINSYSQVLNVDRETETDTLKKAYYGVIDLDFSADKQQNTIFSTNSKAELGKFLKKDLVFILINSTQMILNGNESIENNGYFQLRFRDNDKRKLFPDSYAQYQWNNVIGMQQRYIIGSNLRVNWIEKKGVDLYTGIGGFYENEIWQTDGSAFELSDTNLSAVRSLFRLNTTIKFAKKINDKIDFSGVNYLQFPINENFKLPRWFLNFQINMAITNKLSFLIQYEHNYDLYRPLPIDDLYYSLTFGVKIQF